MAVTLIPFTAFIIYWRGLSLLETWISSDNKTLNPCGDVLICVFWWSFSMRRSFSAWLAHTHHSVPFILCCVSGCRSSASRQGRTPRTSYSASWGILRCHDWEVSESDAWTSSADTFQRKGAAALFPNFSPPPLKMCSHRKQSLLEKQIAQILFIGIVSFASLHWLFHNFKKPMWTWEGRRRTRNHKVAKQTSIILTHTDYFVNNLY